VEETVGKRPKTAPRKRADGQAKRKPKHVSDRERILQGLDSLDRALGELVELQRRYSTKAVADAAHRRNADIGTSWRRAIDQLQRLRDALPKPRGTKADAQ
jgi:hypothetical protein